MPSKAHHTPKERLHLRRHQRKHGPSAQRRKARREALQICTQHRQPKPCPSCLPQEAE